jgi:hypothetical protein
VSPARSLLPLLLGALLAAPAAADARPPGSWTAVRSDAFTHYACVERHRTDGPWWVRTTSEATRSAGRRAVANGIGVWTVITRGSDRNQVSTQSRDGWAGGRLRTTLRKARSTDRLWMQGAYYGPTEPWRDGIRVGRLAACD